MRIVKSPKKRMVWITIAFPLVLKLPNSTVRVFPGSWKRRPGERSMKSNSPITIGAQSTIAEPSLCCKSVTGTGTVKATTTNAYKNCNGTL
ncbi:hypothetical protein QQP08_011911 [Theobroma cacao]|nr:hypothetical protein QQP08_011911 [Theobroma cacao]